MLFEWDDNKDKINQNKHGVSFDVASTVFSDPLHLIIPNDVVDYEERWSAIGRVKNGNYILLVVHTYRDHDDQEITRIISARKLSTGEIKNYGYY